MILIAGAGISGLSLAFELKKRGKDFLLIDPSSEAGGKIRTIIKDGYQMDTGPNTLLADDGIMAFLEELGLKNEIEFPTDLSSKRFIFRNGKFHGISPHPLSLLGTGLISWSGKFRLWQERNIPPASVENESLAAFVRRRFGAEVLDWIASPVQYGIHAANPEELILSDAFPLLAGLEKEYGSIIRGLQRRKSGGRPQTLSFKGGMQTLSRKLSESAADKLILDTHLIKASKEGSGWSCVLEKEGVYEQLFADALVVCMPAPEAAVFCRNSGLDELASGFEKIRYNPMAVAHMVFSDTGKKDFQGFGGLVPAAAGFRSAGSIWVSSIFQGRNPVGNHLLAGFLGGALQREVADMDENTLMEIIQTENAQLYGRKATAFPDITIWKEGIPHYNLQRRKAEEMLTENRPEGIFFLGNWKGGIGLADCIRNAGKLACMLP